MLKNSLRYGRILRFLASTTSDNMNEYETLIVERTYLVMYYSDLN